MRSFRSLLRHTRPPVVETAQSPAGFALPDPVEVHRFIGRLFVTVGWGGRWGVALANAGDAMELAQCIAAARSEAHSRPRPRIQDFVEVDRTAAEARASWERFCLDTVGVDDVARYSPEARVAIDDTAHGDLVVYPIRSGARVDGAQLRLPADATDAELAVAVLSLLELRATPLRVGAPFGPGTAWLAVRTRRPRLVVEALGLRGTRRLAWAEGVAAASENGVFVTPVVAGWVLATGVELAVALPDPAPLSARLGTEVQFFSAREPAFAMRVADGSEALAEGDVFAAAAAWSVDPRTLDTMSTGATTGVHGALPQTAIRSTTGLSRSAVVQPPTA